MGCHSHLRREVRRSKVTCATLRAKSRVSPKFQIRYSRSSCIAGLHLIGRIGLDERLLAARRFRHLAHLRLLGGCALGAFDNDN